MANKGQQKKRKVAHKGPLSLRPAEVAARQGTTTRRPSLMPTVPSPTGPTRSAFAPIPRLGDPGPEYDKAALANGRDGDWLPPKASKPGPTLHLNPNPPAATRRPAPAAAEVAVAAKSPRAGLSRNTKIAGGVLVGTAAAGGAVALHRRRQRSAAMSKALINPFEDVVVFGKAYKTSFFPQSSSRAAALVPTGKHLGHGNRLGHFRGTGVSPQGTGLRRYTTKTVGLRQGPFGKADNGSAGRQAAGTMWPGLHGAIAGRPGRKRQAMGNELGGGALGSLPGTAAGLTGAGMLAHGVAKPGKDGGNTLITAEGKLSRKGKVGGGLLLGGLAASQLGAGVGAHQGTRRASRQGHYNSKIPAGASHGSRID